jgi:hypothetical protein
MIDESTLRTALDDLVPASDEIAEWDDVLARTAGPSRRTWAPRRSLLIAAACVAVGLVVLMLAGSWRAGPSIVDRAAAAIAAPSSNEILYERINIRVSAPARWIVRNFGANAPRSWQGVAHVWLDGARPHRFRLTIAGAFRYAPGHTARSPGTPPPTSPGELGGRLGNYNGLAYDAASRTLLPVAFDVGVTQARLDPAAFVRAQLTAHRAQVVGSATIRGHDAIRILVRERVFGQVVPVATYFVDAKTYRPLRVVITNVIPSDAPSFPGLPLTSLSTLQQASLPAVAGARYVFDFERYGHLPPTVANGLLTNIRAVHPHATIP